MLVMTSVLFFRGLISNISLNFLQLNKFCLLSFDLRFNDSVYFVHE